MRSALAAGGVLLLLGLGLLLFSPADGGPAPTDLAQRLDESVGGSSPSHGAVVPVAESESIVDRQSLVVTSPPTAHTAAPNPDQAETVNHFGLNLPQWFAEHEVLPGVTLEAFDPSAYEVEDLHRASQSMLMLESEYKRWLQEQDEALRYRLVSLEEATSANDGGAVVLEYASSADSKYLVCNAVEAVPILKLREVFAEMTWSDTWLNATKANLQKQHGGLVWLDPTGDGSTFDIIVDGKVVGFGEMHVPGTL